MINRQGASLRYVDIAKRYGRVQALMPTSLEIAPGEFFAIIGPSGSGKTTLLGVTAGYIPPSGGRILINGEDVVGKPPFRRDIGMVFQNYALFPHMNVAENVGFPLRMRRLARQDVKARVEKILAMVQLDAMAERRPSQLSGGQQQRVALARAAVYDPLLLLMDEPLSALDKNLREAMQDEIKQFQASFGATVLYVTHDQNEAAAMAHRIAIMNQGRIEQIGTPQDLYEHPTNRFVASFLGEANLFDVVSVEVLEGAARLRTSDGLSLIAEHSLEADKISACVRPEAIGLASTPVDGANCLVGKVVDATFTAGSLRYRIRLDGGRIITQRMPSARGAELIEPGDAVHVHWQAEDTLLVKDEEGTS
ncbi:MAG: ABC transporter ATP-binding protein [Geminicoccaceae bacterium]